MKPARIVTFLFTFGFAAFLLKFFLVPAPVEEARTVPLGKIGVYPEGVTSIPDSRVFVIRTSREIYVLAAIDRSTGCRVEWLPAENVFHDSCSPSRYDRSGDPFSGSPATRPLWRPEIWLDSAGRLLMDRSWLLTIPAENVRPSNGNNPVWNQIFNEAHLTDRPGLRDRPPYILPVESRKQNN